MICHRTSPDPTDVVFAHWLLIIAPKKVINSFIKMIRKSSVTSAIKYRCETVFFVVSLTVSEPRDPVSNQVYCLFSYLSLIICHLPIQFESERAVINSKRRTERNNCAVIVGKINRTKAEKKTRSEKSGLIECRQTRKFLVRHKLIFKKSAMYATKHQNGNGIGLVGSPVSNWKVFAEIQINSS